MKLAIATALRFLDELAWPAFIERDGCYFLASSAPKHLGAPESIRDRTELEALHNHIHVLDMFRNSARLPAEPWWDPQHPDFLRGCRIARTLAGTWCSKLAHDFPGLPFRVYFAQRDDPVVRFHLLRPGEPAWLDPANWSEQIRLGEIVVHQSEACSARHAT